MFRVTKHKFQVTKYKFRDTKHKFQNLKHNFLLGKDTTLSSEMQEFS